MKILLFLLFFNPLPSDNIKVDTIHRNTAYEQLKQFKQQETIHSSIHTKLDSIIIKLKKQRDEQRIIQVRD